MNNKCIVFKNRRKCLTYQLGGLVGTWCDKFIEEPEITEEQQKERDEAQEKKKSIVEKLIERIRHS